MPAISSDTFVFCKFQIDYFMIIGLISRWYDASSSTRHFQIYSTSHTKFKFKTHDDICTGSYQHLDLFSTSTFVHVY